MYSPFIKKNQNHEIEAAPADPFAQKITLYFTLYVVKVSKNMIFFHRGILVIEIDKKVFKATENLHIYEKREE